MNKVSNADIELPSRPAKSLALPVALLLAAMITSAALALAHQQITAGVTARAVFSVTRTAALKPTQPPGVQPAGDGYVEALQRILAADRGSAATASVAGR